MLDTIREDEKRGERPGFEKIKLLPGVLVTGVVTSPEGGPLAAVSVTGESGSTARCSTVTDGDGRFRLNLEKAGNGRIKINTRDLGIFQKELGEQRGDIGEIRFPAGIRVDGRVVDDEGRAVAGAPISLTETGKRGLIRSTSVVRLSQSDADGRFIWNGLADGEYLVKATAKPTGVEVFVASRLTIKDGQEPVSLEIKAVPCVEFKSRVVDSADNSLCDREVSVKGTFAGEPWYVIGKPDSNGVVSSASPSWPARSNVERAERSKRDCSFSKSRGQPLQRNRRDRFINLGTMNDDVKDFTIVRYQAPVALISAVDEAQNPIKDYHVIAEYKGMANGGNSSADSSDFAIPQKDGRHRLFNLRPDEEVCVKVFATGFSPETQDLKLTEGETKEFTVTLKKSDAAGP